MPQTESTNVRFSSGPISVVIPAKNEASTIGTVIDSVRLHLPDSEIIVVDDGSEDDTAKIANQHGALVHRHPVSLGNGAAVKTGARRSTGDIIVFLDADGQHNPADIPRLLAQIDAGYDMVVGARSTGSHANIARLMANGGYNVIASLVTGRNIPDLTSGFRAVKSLFFKKFLYLLPNGFSYPTTITMAFIRSGLLVDFVDIKAAKRKGKSHIKPLRDGLRFLLIIFKIATLYSPLKLFLPTAGAFLTVGIGYYAYTLLAFGRFTNMSLLLLSAGVIIFLIGLVSEQITTLLYSRSTD
ncbi:glycosyltransferase family 2 protein [Wenzhouxiangella marina]|uniref:Glycosyl transferase n=1 Tax=Wenzhouxiangella marina TaxID=1579979 RepID=A0A0K0XX91_9GAMM|nr:glycosyltransferase family 2 protein [Wenzhouxiangella marina]AKS42247.1 glycosyl transferase [Wenzhouxiangella marina]MBB6085981.1 glycosyltransferase involved in cell wall biosynthesis [Wenzhouxiangella marina]